MLNKWEQILINWINCYFNESTKNVESVDLESLITIISHLRENLNLDESKSSILEANTVEEFIVEKFPEFKFENGTQEVASYENLCLGASLLLFFVCVNSKNVNIKNAMCSKLSVGDQEIILKFSKSLMECSGIKLRDVYAAITEACGQDIAAMENGGPGVTVAETPPALRSLHSEVRRLQAALDAEKFDRNYLQEELARTNLRVEKLLKDKEQYKLDIINLKTKISLCCGEEGEARSVAKEASESGKLAQQLQEAEERLVAVQNQLDDVVYDRDTCKSKLAELKQERDKWFALSQEESAHVCQLMEELNSERREVQSLRELVAELRMHLQRNCLDSSQLECDDPDASVQSLPHNISVCSDVCANVVEVQLGEERAKVLLLKQQINSLQDQLNEMNQKYENEKHSLESIIAEKDDNIFNLKHRINEEIEENNILTTNFNEEIAKLNNEINELEQKLKENNENARLMTEKRMEEIKILQEEKLSLLQSLNDETTKLNNKIKDLQMEVDSEKQAKLNMKESYENHIMKLNEKLLNRNNELVELQNNMLETSEMIESLHLNLRHEKKHKEDLIKKYDNDVSQLNDEKNSLENKLSHMSEELQEVQRNLQQKINLIEELNNSIDEFKATIVDLNENCSMLEETKGKLMTEIEIRDSRVEDLEKQLSNIKIMYRDEKEQLLYSLDESNASINSLHQQLQNEIHYKVMLQDELSHQHNSKTALTEECNKLDTEMLKLRQAIQEKNNIIDEYDMYLQEERNNNEKLNAEVHSLNGKIKEMEELIIKKDDDIKLLEQNLEQVSKNLGEELRRREDSIKSLNKKITTTLAEKDILKSNLFSLNEDKGVLEKDLEQKTQENSSLHAKCSKLSKTTEENKTTIMNLGQKLRLEIEKYEELENNFEKETSKMMVKLNETERIIKELSINSNKTINSQELRMQTLTMEMEDLTKAIQHEKSNTLLVQQEKEALLQKLTEESCYITNIQDEYRNQCVHLETVTAQLTEEINAKNDKIKGLTAELENTRKEKCEDIKVLESKLTSESETLSEIMYQKKTEATKFQKKINELESLNDELEVEMNNIIETKSQVIVALEKENEQLHFTIEEDNSNHEVLLKEKDTMIDMLEQQLKNRATELESIRKDYEDITLSFAKFKVDMKDNLDTKETHIKKLNVQTKVLEQNLTDSEKANEALSAKIVEICKEIEDLEQRRRREVLDLNEAVVVLEKRQAECAGTITVLENQLTEAKTLLHGVEMEKAKLDQEHNALIDSNNELLNEKIILTQQLSEERSVRHIIEEEKQEILIEKQSVDEELAQLIEDKECLTYQLLEEQTACRIVEKERDNVKEEKEKLIQELREEKSTEEDRVKQIKYLLYACSQANASNNILQEEKESLMKELEETKTVKDTLAHEKEAMIVENERIKQEMLEKVTVNDALVSEKELLMVEKESIQISLSEEKSVRDAFESENDMLKVRVNELVEQHRSNMDEKQREIESAELAVKQLKREFQEQQEASSNISTTLSVNLNKILQKLRNEDVTNEILQRLVSTDNKGNLSVADQCDLLINIADTLTTELSLRKNLEKALQHENTALEEMQKICEQKDVTVLELQTEIRKLQQVAQENKIELSKRVEAFTTALDSKSRDIQTLQSENQSLHNDLNDVKLQLEVKVHSLKEKLIDNENLTDKLKRTYECQIDNMNMMISKLTNYLRDKTTELEALRKEKERLQEIVEQNNKAIQSLEEEVKSEKQKQEKLIEDFESERLVLKNMVTVTESVMEDQKVSLNKVITEHVKTNEVMQDEYLKIKEQYTAEYEKLTAKLQEKETAFQTIFAELTEVRSERDVMKTEKDSYNAQVKNMQDELNSKEEALRLLEGEHSKLTEVLQKCESDIKQLEENNNELKIRNDATEVELQSRIEKLTKELDEINKNNDILQNTIVEKDTIIGQIKIQLKEHMDEMNALIKEKNDLEREKNEFVSQLEGIRTKLECQLAMENDAMTKLKEDNIRLVNVDEENKKVITNLQLLIKQELQKNQQLLDSNVEDKQSLLSKCSILQEYQTKTEQVLADREKDNATLQEEAKTLSTTIEKYADIIKEKDLLINELQKELAKEKAVKERYETELADEKAVKERYEKELEDEKAVKEKYEKELADEKAVKEKYEKELADEKAVKERYEKELADVKAVKEKYEKELADEKAVKERYEKELESVIVMKHDLCVKEELVKHLKMENDELVKAVGQRETFAVFSQEKSGPKFPSHPERDPQVYTTPDTSHSSMESHKTITDLEKIIHDKNRTITTLQTDITYIKSIMAESENKLLDVTKELEVSKENCHQLSSQLKKIVYQKNEEIAELKKQVNKMSVTENRASQIIKVSARYQAIILKRIAEIKSNTVLKELTNFGNSNSSDNELRRGTQGLNAGTITMEDLENFLETTDKHLKRCSEKQIALQKERDRLTEVNRINESEIINMQKFLTELSISFQTFNSVKDLYTQKLSRVVSVQRTVRREILSLDQRVTDATMCKLERGYAAVIQDLAECAMNLERWLERCISRAISPEKIKQAFTSDTERSSLAPTSFQNAGLEVQLEELEKSFEKLLEEIARAQKGEGAKEAQAVTVMEVRAEYEDKLNRMKAKMKQLYQEQIAVFMDKQREEIAVLERELQKSRDRLAESSRKYEDHIRALTTELWNVGEKFIMKKDEAEWLRRRNKSGSLMSLQHVHSSGLAPPQEEPARPSDSHSLRSLPMATNTNTKREGRGLYMSDEEGEVFDNRWLKELSATPRRESKPSGQRLSELRFRNSLCPPHLKSSYPAEMQFAPTLDEEDIKCVAAGSLGGRGPRKEVGITAYKKPGPPTPSKQAGRLSATDSELRESLRVEAEPQPGRKTSTPSRIRSLFRSNKTDTVEGTPRSRRLSNIFRKK